MGGVQAMLRRHWRDDAACGVHSRFIACFDPQPGRYDRVRGLGLTWRNTIRTARRRFAAALPPEIETVIYHDFWGLGFFAEFDRAQRRIGFLHAVWPGLPDLLPLAAPYLDGLFCAGRPWRTLAEQRCPGFSAERMCVTHLPVDRPAPETRRDPVLGQPLVLGFVGRLSPEKGVHRIPPLVRTLAAAGLDFRFEVLGDGRLDGWLRRELAGESRVRFHGQQTGAAYWDVLRTWDAMVVVSDMEGGPTALYEAMSVGVLPLFPAAGGGGADYAPAVDPEFLYPPGDFQHIAKVLRRLVRRPPAEIQALRHRSGELILEHLGNRYVTTVAEFVRHINRLPRLSRASFPQRPFYLTDQCPFGLLRRISVRSLWRGMGG